MRAKVKTESISSLSLCAMRNGAISQLCCANEPSHLQGRDFFEQPLGNLVE
jgi:hypothetical protein